MHWKSLLFIKPFYSYVFVYDVKFVSDFYALYIMYIFENIVYLYSQSALDTIYPWSILFENVGLTNRRFFYPITMVHLLDI